jgi:endonuclease-3
MACAIQNVRRILRLLERAYGPRAWKCWGKGIDVLVETILSQSTSNANSKAGYKRLRRRFKSWKAVADAPVQDVARAIAVSGLSQQKAPRIQTILRAIKESHRKMDLQFLAELDEQMAYEYLTKFKGVGPKTANCVLLFAFGKPLFPVDTHIHRIARRLQWIGPKATAEQAHEILRPMISPEDRYAMHVLLIEHGRKTCKAINPQCERCVLLKMCPFGQTRVAASRIAKLANDEAREPNPSRRPEPRTSLSRRRR